MVRDNVEAILSQLQTAGVSYAKQTPGGREKLMSLCHDLISTLELPSESIMRMAWAEVSLPPYAKRGASQVSRRGISLTGVQPAKAAHFRIAVDLDIFGHIKRSGAAGITAKDLAAKCNADEVLICRSC